MTGALGASLLAIVASAVALVFGWIEASAALVTVSIVLTGGAAVLLALAYYRSAGEARAIEGRKRGQKR